MNSSHHRGRKNKMLYLLDLRRYVLTRPYYPSCDTLGCSRDDSHHMEYSHNYQQLTRCGAIWDAPDGGVTGLTHTIWAMLSIFKYLQHVVLSGMLPFFDPPFSASGSYVFSHLRHTLNTLGFKQMVRYLFRFLIREHGYLHHVVHTPDNKRLSGYGATKPCYILKKCYSL